MEGSIVRIKRISIQDFKNIRWGELNFDNSRKDSRKNCRASVMGVYGQNGSGKTALIDVLQLLKFLLTGQPIPARFADYVNVDAEYAAIQYEFKVSTGQISYDVIYGLCLKKGMDRHTHNLEAQDWGSPGYIAVVFDESLSCSYVGTEIKGRMAQVINTQTAEVFLPKAKYHLLVGSDRAIFTELLVDKKMSAATSRSFIFSSKFLMAVRQNGRRKDKGHKEGECLEDGHLDGVCQEDGHADGVRQDDRHKGGGYIDDACIGGKHKNKDRLEYDRYRCLLEALVLYGNYQLFVIHPTNPGFIRMDTLPISYKCQEPGLAAVGNLRIPLNEAATVLQETYTMVEHTVANMNVVLTQLVPGLTIGLRDLGDQVMKNGKTGKAIQLISLKNNQEIPLQYESEGIKKIISILQLLIAAYNQPSITVAVDELDSGVFEYLLGEILRIICEKGKGQLIFTSHNLRPLETIGQGFIAFTTANPHNRFIQIKGGKEHPNLRAFYYRDIVLGEQQEVVYEPTNRAEIALAFREAGGPIGT